MKKYENITWVLIVIATLIIAFNQVTILQVSGMTTSSRNTVDFSSIDLSSIKSTGHSVAAFFPVEDIETAQDAVDVMIPTGTPDYGPVLGICYDDPVRGLAVLAPLDRSVQLTPKENRPQLKLHKRPFAQSRAVFAWNSEFHSFEQWFP